MSPVKSHDRDFFYKYFQFDGAIKTLENKTFLYKAPTFFNDPFDSQITLQPGLSDRQMADIFFEAMTRAILEKRAEPRLGLTEEQLATLPPGLDRERLLKMKWALLAHIPNNYFIEEFEKAAESQWKSFKNNFVFCVTEKHDDLLMWSHYADEHKGAVFKIKCIEEKQSLLCACLPVTYSDEYPKYGTVEEWSAFLHTGEAPSLEKVYEALITTKSTHWRYEKEWRMVFPRPEDSGKECVFLGFHAEEIESVFLGCRMPEENKSLLLKLVKDKYPWVKVFQARKSRKEFRLHFEEVPLGPKSM